MGEIQTCFRRIEKKYLLTYGQYEAMKKGMAPYVRPDAYSHYTLVYVVNPPRKNAYQKDSSNNSSLIVSVYNGENSFLFTGDAQTERLSELLDSGCARYDLLKLPHHGQEDERLETLLQAVQPGFAVITSSDEEPESEAVLALLNEYEADVFLTRVAPIVITSDGKTLQTGYDEDIVLEDAA